MAPREDLNEKTPRKAGEEGLPPLLIGRRRWPQAQLAEAIVQGKLTSAEHELVSEYFWVYGFKVVKTLLRTGELAKASLTQGQPIMFEFGDQRLLRESEEHRDELAAEVLLRAVPFFFKNVRSWNPEKGAALTTYFVGSCVMNFANAYRAWAKARNQRWLTAYEMAAIPWLDPSNSHTFTDHVELIETVKQVFALAKPKQLPILGLLYQGYSQVEVAEQLGITPRSVEGHVYRLRKQVVLAVVAGKITPPAGFTSEPASDQAKGPVML